MKYTSQTSDINISSTLLETTAQQVVQRGNIKYISPKFISLDMTKIEKGGVYPEDRDMEELSPEEENKFYKKVMRTSLL